MSSSETLNAIAAAPGYAHSAVASNTFDVPVTSSGGAFSPMSLLPLPGFAGLRRKR